MEYELYTRHFHIKSRNMWGKFFTADIDSISIGRYVPLEGLEVWSIV